MGKEKIDHGETAMEQLLYPDYNDRDAFKTNGLYDLHKKCVYKGLSEIRRTDYISYNKLDEKERVEFLNSIAEERLNDLNENGLEYKDNIFQRYFFKEFHIRERIGNSDKHNFYNDSTQLILAPGYSLKRITVYYHYDISDYSDDNNYDDRVLTANTIVSAVQNEISTPIEYNIVSFKIFVAHAQFLYDTIVNNIKLDKGGKIKEIYFNGITDFPLLMMPLDNPIPMSNEKVKYIHVKDLFKSFNYNFSVCSAFLWQILRSIRLFMDFNYYLLNTMEEDKPVSIVGESDKYTIVEYIKMEANMDKKIRINLDKDENIKLNIDPKADNIYSHNQKVIRRLCDYKFQVCGHWHTYWYGPKNDPEKRYKKLKWVEPYFKNKDKEFVVTKERVKNKYVLG